MSPELRLHRAALILRSLEQLGAQISYANGRFVCDPSTPGRPLIEQLNRFYIKEALACIRAAAVIDGTNHV